LNVVLNRKKAGHGKFYMKNGTFLHRHGKGYKRWLSSFLKVRWLAWVLVAVCIGIIGFIITGLQSEIAPLEDRSSIRFTVTAAEGTEL
jgi:HAE1 family hydrophobic/amphiphilic exporter-1/multidrug efflux pump